MEINKELKYYIIHDKYISTLTRLHYKLGLGDATPIKYLGW